MKCILITDCGTKIDLGEPRLEKYNDLNEMLEYMTGQCDEPFDFVNKDELKKWLDSDDPELVLHSIIMLICSENVGFEQGQFFKMLTRWKNNTSIMEALMEEYRNSKGYSKSYKKMLHDEFIKAFHSTEEIAKIFEEYIF